MPQTTVTSFAIRNRRIRKVILKNTESRKQTIVEPEQIVSASGAWANKIASMAGINIPMIFSKGSLIVAQNRLTERVVNRLRKPANGDILVAGGTVSIVGTTSVRAQSPDRIHPGIREVDEIIREGSAMAPSLDTVRYIRAYCGVRPLIRTEEEENDRDVSRGFALLDHSGDGIENFVTVTGGKLTTYRLMAEKTADLVCTRLGEKIPCPTQTTPLHETIGAKWTKPGAAPRMWIQKNDPEDLLICECEMVPKSTIHAVMSSIKTGSGASTLNAIGLRSRIGKGPCQGTFCSLRLAALLYDRDKFSDSSGLSDIRAFLRERWRGQRPLLWGTALAQSELQEALHCGLLGLEMDI
jgi:glycerol-3-phosphate dehydrogenase